MHRSDLTSVIPDFITLAEAKLNRRLRLRAMENVATGSVASSISLPTGYVEMRALTAASGTVTWPLTYTPPEQIDSQAGTPSEYSIAGELLYFLPYSSSYTYSLTYYKKFDALSGGVNWLITNAPDVYLYSTLLETAPYLGDDQRITVWSSLLEAGISALEQNDKSDRYGSSLAVKVA